MKRTFSLLVAFVLAVIMCVSGAAMTLDTAELAAEETTETVEEVKIVPGINVVNGTTEIEDFEGDAVPSTLTPNAMGSFKLSTEKAVSGTQSLKGTGNGNYPKFYIDMPCEAGRMYYVHFSVISDLAADKEHACWLMQDGASSNHIFKDYSPGFKTNSPNGKWYTVGESVTAKTDNPFYFQNKINGASFYYDDLAIIPFYKITYIGLDGETVAGTDQALVDAHGNLLTKYIPDLSKVEGATGYALTQGGERIAEVTLANKDVVLYAIDTPVVGLAYGDEYKNVTVEGDTYTFPVASKTFEGVENFFVYSDGASFYKEGETAAAADVIGKTFTAVCTTYKAFDAGYGELALFIDYDLVGVDTVPGSVVNSGNIIPSYQNTGYVTSGITHSDSNGVASADVIEVDGNRVLLLKTRTTSGHNYWRMNFTAETVGKYRACETAKAEDTQGVEDIATLFGSPWHRFIQTSGSDLSSTLSKPTADWTTQYTAKIAKVGIKGSGFSYTRASSAMLPNIYKDDYALYVYPSYAVYFIPAADSEDFTKVNVDTTATKFTFPKPEDIGYEAENFAMWTNGTLHFEAGEETDLANVQYTAFYPFYQAKNVPAMGFTFEGDVKHSAVEVSNPIYTKNIIDYGRDVLLVHWFNGNGGEGTSFPTDLRLSFKTKTYSDPKEYNIIQYSTKAPSAWAVKTENNAVVRDEDGNALYTALTSKNYRIYAHQSAAGDYTKNAILVKSETINMSDSYTIKEYDLSGNAGFIERGGYGFCVDPLQATYGANVYIDYLRVYRKGLQTITYATNAPKGATVVKEVAADKNRGLGYGYLLKDVRPEVEGYVFLGWGLTPDATETVNSITVDGNETVYAVWAKADTVDTPEVTDEVEIRGNGENNGIRFKSAIKPSVKANLDEFGFLATREVLLPYADAEKTTRNHDYLTFNHKVNGADANYYVQGIAYDADGGIDKENGNNTDGSTVYTAVLSGIPMENKNEKMVVRSYAKYTVNGKEMVVYGNTNAASLYETAVAIKGAGGTAYTNNQTYIDEIVG